MLSKALDSRLRSVLLQPSSDVRRHSVRLKKSRHRRIKSCRQLRLLGNHCLCHSDRAHDYGVTPLFSTLPWAPYPPTHNLLFNGPATSHRLPTITQEAPSMEVFTTAPSHQ